MREIRKEQRESKPLIGDSTSPSEERFWGIFRRKKEKIPEKIIVYENVG